jgi:hypothetical protein
LNRRILVVIACICGIAATAFFIRSLEITSSARRAALRDFDRFAREAADGLADVRAAQQAYVAFGQGTGYWMPKVDTTMQRVAAALAALQPSATTPASSSALDQAVAATTEFSNVDARIRQYLETGEQLMAADIVFAEGGKAAAAASQHVERAQIEEQLAFDQFERGNKKLEIAAAAAAASVVLLVTAILAFVPLKRTAETGTTSLSPDRAGSSEAESARRALLSGHDLPLREEDQRDLHIRDVTSQPADRRTADDTRLQSIAQLCTDIGRVGDSREVVALLSRAAELLDASGVVLWLGAASGSELRPALAHGYSPETVSRIPVVPRSANNAAAAAYRSGALQIVLSQPGSPAKGAVVAPVLSPDGCVGVLSAEIRGGGETSATTQSLATIFAAQFAGIVAATAGVPEQRATGSGPV